MYVHIYRDQLSNGHSSLESGWAADYGINPQYSSKIVEYSKSKINGLQILAQSSKKWFHRLNSFIYLQVSYVYICSAKLVELDSCAVVHPHTHIPAYIHTCM